MSRLSWGGLAGSRGRLQGLAVTLIMVCGCSPQREANSELGVSPVGKVLLRVGAVEVRESDLVRHLDEAHAGRRDDEARELALAELGERAQLVGFALSTGLADDPTVRGEVSRILVNRVRETRLVPLLNEVGVSEKRLRDLYETNLDQFQANEKRQVAVLWLDPGKDPERLKAYQEKLKAARAWASEQSELAKNPGRGFAELSVDYSEHLASRFGGGIVGWMEKAGGLDDWTKAVAEIVFGLTKIGEVSEVVTRPEGVFLVRYLAHSSRVVRPFETVKSDLERQELRRLKEQTEADFLREVDQEHPIEKETVSVDERATAGVE